MLDLTRGYIVMPEILGTAELLGEFEHGTKEWHDLRGELIGSSDVASILGLSPYKSAYTLWHEKAGLVQPVEPDQKQKRKFAYGHHMEPFVAGLFQEEWPGWDVRTTGTWRHTDRLWQGCNPDRLVMSGDALVGLLEIKTFPSLNDWPDGPPPGYVAQLKWQLDTFGLERGWIVGYANLSGDYVEYPLELDPFEADATRAKVREFAESVDSGNPPEIDGSNSTYQTVRKLNPSIVPKLEVQTPPAVAEFYLAARKAFTEADLELTKWKGHLLAHMGTAQYAFYDGRKIASRVGVKDGVPYLKEA
jgi:putative phage-type endonuclease